MKIVVDSSSICKRIKSIDFCCERMSWEVLMKRDCIIYDMGRLSEPKYIVKTGNVECTYCPFCGAEIKIILE